MRQHFHRCGHLRVIAIEASDLSHARKGGSQIVEELCEARGLARCVGLAECDVLAPAQKRDLLAARATRLRAEEGGASLLADAPNPRAAELRELLQELLDERQQLVEENRRRVLEGAAALRRNPRPVGMTEEREFGSAGISVVLADDLRELRTARLDAIDRGLEAMAQRRYGDCVRCARPIEVTRLRIAPDTVVCTRCAREALPDPPQPARESPEARARIHFG